MNKKVLIGLGVLAVAGVGFYMWKRRKNEKDDENTDEKSGFNSNASGEVRCDTTHLRGNYNLPEEKANARGAGITNKMCCTEELDANKYCHGTWVSCSRLSALDGTSNAIGTRNVVSSIGNVQAKQNCADKSKIWCTKRQPDGTYKDGCLCSNPTKDIGTKIEDSGFNGYMNSVNNPMYNDLTLLVDPANV